jgi:hypothetical protein
MNRTVVRILVFLLLGATYMVTCNGCSGAGRYKKYSSADPRLNITMDYISGWEGKETRGANNSYFDVYFGEPWDKAGTKTRRAFMEVTSFQGQKPASGIPTISTVADGLMDSELKFKDCKLLSKAKVRLPAGEAMDLAFSFKSPDKLYSVKAKLMSAKERIVVLKNGDWFYAVRYQNWEEVFDKYDKEFTHMVRSIRFKEKK